MTLVNPETTIENTISQMLKTVATLIGSVSIILGAIVWLGEPRFEEYLNERDRATLDEIKEIRESQQEIKNLLRGLGPEKTLEFLGIGYIVGNDVYKPGDTVKVLYQMKRNNSCSLNVQVRFLNADTGHIDSSLTYEIPATRASITEDYIIFPVDVRLPEHMPDGVYSYNPIMTPTCGRGDIVTPPISKFFKVEK